MRADFLVTDGTRKTSAVVVTFENSKLRRSGIVGKYVAPTELADFVRAALQICRAYGAGKKARRDDGECVAAGARRFGFNLFQHEMPLPQNRQKTNCLVLLVLFSNKTSQEFHESLLQLASHFQE